MTAILILILTAYSAQSCSRLFPPKLVDILESTMRSKWSEMDTNKDKTLSRVRCRCYQCWPGQRTCSTKLEISPAKQRHWKGLFNTAASMAACSTTTQRTCRWSQQDGREALHSKRSRRSSISRCQSHAQRAFVSRSTGRTERRTTTRQREAPQLVPGRDGGESSAISSGLEICAGYRSIFDESARSPRPSVLAPRLVVATAWF